MSRPECAVIVNPAAGGGAAGRLIEPWVDRLRAAGKVVSLHRTAGPGHATKLARQASARGAAEVVAVGGDGTVYEVLNGLLPSNGQMPALGVLPLGTGNSFARDFGLHDPEAAFVAITGGSRTPVDVVRVTHRDGELYSINLVSVGFTAEAGSLTNRRFKALGAVGYVAAVVVCVARLKRPLLPISLDDGAIDDRPCVLLSFSNSKYTGGQMKMAPEADPTDGLVDVIRVGPMGRRRLLTVFPRIFNGTHVQAPEIETARARRVDFSLDGPAEVLVDGEVLSLQLDRLEVMPGAVELLA